MSPCGRHGGPIRNSATATETANTTATRAVVFHPSSSVGFPNPSSSVGFPHPRQRDGGGRNDVGVAGLVDGLNDGRRRRECLVFMSQLPNGGGGAQARRPERRDFKRQGFDRPRTARIGAERSAHHAHSSHNIAEKCESSSMRVTIPIIPMIYSTHSVHRVGGWDHCQSCLGNFRNGSNPEVWARRSYFLSAPKTKHRRRHGAG